MGFGHFDSDDYYDSSATRKSKGIDDFAYSADVRSGRAAGVHATLDTTKMTNGVRESRDSDDHPNSIPVVIFFDHTGSMGALPRLFQKNLANVMDVILAKAKIPDPQILVGAVGDAYCDPHAFQAGQFESGNQFDEQLRNIVIDGGGGGQDMESYALCLYFAANHVVTDAWEKRGKRGYLFTIGDEKPHPSVTAAEAKKYFNVDTEHNEKVEDLIVKTREKWEHFHICPQTSTGRHPDIQQRWRDLIGERLVILNDENLLSETIAALIFMMETACSVDTVVDAVGVKGDKATSLKNALVPVMATCVPSHIAKGGLPASHKGGKSGVSKL